MTPRILLGYAQAKVVPGLLLFFSVPVLMSLFGASVYGEYSRVWAVAVVLTSLFTGWVQQGLLRTAGMSEFSIRSILISARLAAVLLTACGTGIATLMQREAYGFSHFVAGALFGGLWAWSAMYEAAAQRDGRIGAYSLGAFTRAFGAGFLPLGVYYLFDSQTVITIVLSAAVGSFIAAIAYQQGAESARSVKPDADFTRRLYNFGWPMSLWLGLSSILLYMDRWVIALAVSPDQSGVYAAYSDMIVRGFAMVGMPLSLAIHPFIMTLSNAKEASPQRISSILRKWRRVAIMFLGFGVIVSTGFFALVGSNHLEMGRLPTLALFSLSLGAALWQLAILSHKEHEVGGQTRTMLTCLAVSTLGELMVLVVLVPLLGNEGAALGVTAGALTYLSLIKWTRRPIAPSTGGSLDR